MNQSTAYTTNGLNQYTVVGPNAEATGEIDYDDNGNLIKYKFGSEQHTYTYDAENKLVAAVILDVLDDGGPEACHKRLRFYESMGFRSFPSREERMFLTMKDITAHPIRIQNLTHATGRPPCSRGSWRPSPRRRS